MYILENNEIKSEQIKELRNILHEETKETMFFLGIRKKSIERTLPIRDRKFNIWIAVNKENNIVGFLTFEDKDKDDVFFIKEFFIVDKFRKHGYGLQLFKLFVQSHQKVYCSVNSRNTYMYDLLKKSNMKCEIPTGIAAVFSAADNKNYDSSKFNPEHPTHWSNYLGKERYYII